MATKDTITYDANLFEQYKTVALQANKASNMAAQEANNNRTERTRLEITMSDLQKENKRIEHELKAQASSIEGLKNADMRSAFVSDNLQKNSRYINNLEAIKTYEHQLNQIDTTISQHTVERDYNNRLYEVYLESMRFITANTIANK